MRYLYAEHHPEEEREDPLCRLVDVLIAVEQIWPAVEPGEYTLGEVGISLAGRGVVLDVNHRNTAEILEFAKEMVADDQFVDIEGVDGVGDTVSAISRSGPRPAFHRFASRADHDRSMIDRLGEVLRLIGTGHGDVGVLTSTNRQADDVRAVLRDAGVPVVMLDEYTGRTTDAVRVGTVKRAKGLEFKQVLFAHVDRGMVDAVPASRPSRTGSGGSAGGGSCTSG